MTASGRGHREHVGNILFVYVLFVFVVACGLLLSMKRFTRIESGRFCE